MIFARETLSDLAVILSCGFVILNQNDVIMNAASFCHFEIHIRFQLVMGCFQNDTSFCPAFCHFEKNAFLLSALSQNDKITFPLSPYGRERRLTAFSPPSVEGVCMRDQPRRFEPVSIFKFTTGRRFRR